LVRLDLQLAQTNRSAHRACRIHSKADGNFQRSFPRVADAAESAGQRSYSLFFFIARKYRGGEIFLDVLALLGAFASSLAVLGWDDS
jgi:hypothetical protein